MSARQSQRRYLLIGLLLATLAVVVFYLMSGEPTAESAATPALAQAAVSPAPPPHARPPVAAPAQPAPSPSDALVPIIDAVELEKQEVCVGEENLVSVKAHTEGNHEDEYLHAVIGGRAGMRVPIVATGRAGEETSPRLVTVFGRDNVAVTVPVPPYTVKECTVPRQLVLSARLQVNTEAEYEIHARLVEIDSDSSFDVEHYRWDFGDGSTTETAEPFVSHDYSGRPQNELYSNILVAATAVSTSGETVTGRMTLTLRNTAFVNLKYAGVVTLMVDLNPRFPTRDDHGVVTQNVRLWHHHQGLVRIRRAVARRNFDDAREPEQEEVSVTRLLGQSTIPPQGVETSVSLDTHRDPHLFSVDYLLEGVTDTGVPARGTFSVMRPPPTPTPENSTPVHDPIARARIKRAMDLLHKKFVTEEEMRSLEEQGAFADLLPPKGAEPQMPPPRYGDMPPHPARQNEPSPTEPLRGADEVPPLPPAP